MIDLHCHILPGLDDGAQSLEDSLAMARQAACDGIELVCATPHIRHDHRVRIGGIAARVRALQRALDEHAIGVRIAPGGELAQTEADRLDERELRSLALGGAGGWLLVEPAPGPLDDSLGQLAERLAARGFASIVAHPERHGGADFVERLQRLAGIGCLIQWTAELFASAAPSDFAMELAAKGFVHVLGSDAHSSRAGRPVRLGAAFERLATVRTSEQIEWMKEVAPRAILRGAPVPPQP